MIYFIIPKYMNEIGDCCIIKDSEGERIKNKRINSVLNGICLTDA
ncbi:hypothetical protein Q428_00745 [Fervidicella metallireducens AeB]|uniref:Uncharacterized protein n=1 Tax=Fervidicella metallireducens AeB TaxID=1403537 RepID=A0A017RZ66_9CLOT|nr:hypothetical protein [Fervidicella metallireducens]EYE89886.1 hypothetical protein Q428_00745 [Fervidicella metallireducens AeB]